MAGSGVVFVCQDVVAKDLAIVRFPLTLHCPCKKKVLSFNVLNHYPISRKICSFVCLVFVFDVCKYASIHMFI